MASAAAWLALSIGMLGFAGWLFDSPTLKTAFTGNVSMKANASLGICVLAFASLCLLPSKRSVHQLRMARAAGLFAILLGATTLAEHAFDWNAGIDELLFTEPAGEAATASPGRVGPPASTSFVLLGIGLLCFDKRTSRGSSWSQRMALLTAPGALLGILGYITHATQLYGIAKYTGIALHTAVAILALAVFQFLARAEYEPAALLVLDNAGGEVARTVLPAAIVLPLVVGWLRTSGERLGLFDTAFGRALLLLTLMLLLTIVVWRVAKRLSGVAIQHAAAERASSHARAEAQRLAAEHVETLSVLESLLAHAPIGFVFFDRQERCIRVNQYLTQNLPSPGVSASVRELLPGFNEELHTAIHR
ncbi:MAG TPA: hypothetical protein VFQ61_38925, partial [Polyangiaceae bacterium]|nr:hypothetical protein [Polyangiaceae bacterium]